MSSSAASMSLTILPLSKNGSGLLDDPASACGRIHSSVFHCLISFLRDLRHFFSSITYVHLVMLEASSLE